MNLDLIQQQQLQAAPEAIATVAEAAQKPIAAVVAVVDDGVGFERENVVVVVVVVVVAVVVVVVVVVVVRNAAAVAVLGKLQGAAAPAAVFAVSILIAVQFGVVSDFLPKFSTLPCLHLILLSWYLLGPRLRLHACLAQQKTAQTEQKFRALHFASPSLFLKCRTHL